MTCVFRVSLTPSGCVGGVLSDSSRSVFAFVNNNTVWCERMMKESTKKQRIGNFISHLRQGLYNCCPLSSADMFQDPLWMPEMVDGTEP